jgi:hypothetical protein
MGSARSGSCRAAIDEGFGLHVRLRGEVAAGLLIALAMVRIYREDLGLPLSSVEHLAYMPLQRSQ